MNAEYNTQLCKSSIPSGIACSVELCKSSIPSGIARSVEKADCSFTCKPSGLHPKRSETVASQWDAGGRRFHLILPSDAILTDCGKVSLSNIDNKQLINKVKI